MKLKSKDCFIFKVRFYATAYHVKKFLEGSHESHLKHIKAAELYHDFFWKFIEKVNGKTKTYYLKLYTSFTDCAIEEINESHNIKVINSPEGCRTFIIPKENNEELFQWCKENAPNITILTRVCPWWLNREVTTWHRDNFKLSDELKEMLKNL